MKIFDKLYINGQWQASTGSQHAINNPATEQPCASSPLGTENDVVAAISAARAAFPAWSQTSAQQRCDYINAIADGMKERFNDLVDAVSITMGCPKNMTVDLHINSSIDGLRSFAERAFMMEKIDDHGGFKVLKEAIGVCTLINPWNYPLSQLVGKLGPALASGCTVVIKPAEQTPVQDFIMAEIVDKVGLPAGVFNLVSGSGRKLGATLCGHPEVDMVSFTGSTAAGIKVSEAAAPTIKRVCLELGGKSAYIITDDADLETAVNWGIEDIMINTGQTCNAHTRMLVPQSRYDEIVSLAKAAAEAIVVGDPLDENSFMGPMASASQKGIVLDYINKGLEEGARLVTGGTDMPTGVDCGAYVKPTIFADVNNQMAIAREEIFGPVLCMIPYRDIDHAVEIANDSVFGLSSAVYAKDSDSAMAIARRMRAGQCFIQGSFFSTDVPFGGYKQSGNGREWGDEGMSEYIEVKSIICP
ncbi:MAG: aldehyde dehydrogenase family protein [Pseudomonadales bacterium]